MSALQRALASSVTPFSEQGVLAVTICRPNPDQTPPQYHVGVLYQDPDDLRCHFLHLAWHHRLERSLHPGVPPEGKHLWISPAIDPLDIGNVVAVCCDIWNANTDGKIPYGFSDYTNFFNTETWRQIIGPNNIGLTCATFVLAVFKSAQIDLIQPNTWKDRPGDTEWKAQIVDTLKKYQIEQSHIDQVKLQSKGLRYRPSDVAAAALTEAPSAMDELAGSIREIEATVDRICTNK